MKFEDSIQLNFRLIQAFPKEQTIWAKIIEKPVNEIYSLFDEVSQQIAIDMDLTLTEQEKLLLSSAKKVDPEAYQAYLKGIFYWMKLTENDLEQSLKYFLLALKIDPNYAAAYAGIASVGAAKMQNGIVRGIELIPKLDSLMTKALELDNS